MLLSVSLADTQLASFKMLSSTPIVTNVESLNVLTTFRMWQDFSNDSSTNDATLQLSGIALTDTIDQPLPFTWSAASAREG